MSSNVGAILRAYEQAVADGFSGDMGELFASMGRSERLIDEYVCSGGEQTVTLNDLSQDFSHLRIVTSVATTHASSQAWYFTINGDAGANYDHHTLRAIGSAVTTIETVGGVNFAVGGIPSTSMGSYAGHSEILIPNYTGSFYKSMIASSLQVTAIGAGGFRNQRHVGTWKSTEAVSSIAFAASTAPLTAGSKVSIFGMP